METSLKPITTSKSSSELPTLEDPSHPGMLLISRIGLFSSALFVLLIATGLYIAATVSLDIELSLNGVTKSGNEIVLYAEPSRAIMIEVGHKAEVNLDNGNLLEAEVTEVQASTNIESGSIPILLKLTGQLSASHKDNLQNNIGTSISATVFTRHSLWAFLKEKVAY